LISATSCTPSWVLVFFSCDVFPGSDHPGALGEHPATERIPYEEPTPSGDRGQAVIPKEIRTHMGLHPGDMLDFLIQDDHTVVIKPAQQDITQLRGLLHKPGRKAVSLKTIAL